MRVYGRHDDRTLSSLRTDTREWPMSRWTRLAKYAPAAYEVARQSREPVEKAVRAAAQRRQARRTAVQHAGTLKNGTVLRVFHAGQPVWVVFSGDEPRASYPTVDVPLPELLQDADLDKRQSPAELRRPRLGKRRGRAADADDKTPLEAADG